ncbi:MAG: D-glycerate dehydrogenase [Sphingomonadaceae bacterium]|nr:D-glycerate dehydrogenase [Sphingomonadaceae bacterium]
MTAPVPSFSILLTRRWPAEVEARLAERYAVTLRVPDAPMTRAELQAALRSHDALCPTVTDTIDADLLGVDGRRVRFIANYGVGHAHIDLGACRALGIRVSNTPDVLTDATANLAILLMLMASRRAGEGERLLRAGRWPGWAPTQLIGGDLQGRLLGILGFGRIGQAVAAKARAAFGMRIGFHARRRPEPPSQQAGADYFADLDALVAAADILSIHVPGGAETRHLIDARRLRLMKPGAILINTARGTIVDEAALAAALREGRLAAAGLDVYEREPAVEPALRALENAVLLPHLGSATLDTRIAMGLRVAANLDAFFDGLEPPDRVA